jgi:hypothetical protein
MRDHATRLRKRASSSKFLEAAVHRPHSAGHRSLDAVEQVPANAEHTGFAASHLLHLQHRLGNHRVGELLRLAGTRSAASPALSRSALERSDSADGQAHELAPPIVGDVLRSGGEPLETAARALFESRFARDFSHVRVHRDVQAARSAEAVGAAAYTVGNHVVFGNGRYDLASGQGQRLVAHELVHTLQQGGGAPGAGPLPISKPADPSEQEADRVAEAAMSVTPATDATAPSVASGSAPHALASSQSAVENRVAPLTLARQPPQQQQPPPVPLEGADANRIPPADRHGIELAAAGYIPLAFTAFSNATTAHAAAIKNEAKAKAELIAAVIDVATGFLAPVFANYVVSKLTAKAAATATEQVTKKAVVTLISKQDFFKAAFTGATKIANQVMKSNANALFGETEIDAFALALRNTFQRGAGAVLDRLTTMTDDELLAVWTAYDPDNADESAYRHVLGDLFKHYQDQVETIGDKSPPIEGGPSSSSGVFEVQLATRKRLANLTVWSTGEKYLWAWISPDLDAIARAKANALGLPITTVALTDVNVTLAEILDPPRKDLRQKDMLEVARALTPAERARAANDPDFISVVETGREISGRIPNQYERHKTLFVLRGFSENAIAVLDELDSLLFVSGPKINKLLQATDKTERSRLAQDPWFVGRLRAELRGYELDRVLFTLGLGPEPTPPPEPDYQYYMGP